MDSSYHHDLSMQRSYAQEEIGSVSDVSCSSAECVCHVGTCMNYVRGVLIHTIVSQMLYLQK